MGRGCRNCRNWGIEVETRRPQVRGDQSGVVGLPARSGTGARTRTSLGYHLRGVIEGK